MKTAKCSSCMREQASSEITTRTERVLLCERCLGAWYMRFLARFV
jgi:hypothetical protein